MIRRTNRPPPRQSYHNRQKTRTVALMACALTFPPILLMAGPIPAQTASTTETVNQRELATAIADDLGNQPETVRSRIVSLLMKAMNDPSEAIRIDALGSIGKASRPAVPSLVQVLNGDSRPFRIAAIKAIRPDQWPIGSHHQPPDHTHVGLVNAYSQRTLQAQLSDDGVLLASPEPIGHEEER